MKSISDVAELEDMLSEPTDYVIDSLAAAPGDTILLGAGGKMGPTLAQMLVRACKAAGDSRKIMAVSRFSNESARQSLADLGIETISGDLLAEGVIDGLPDADNVLYMAGMKFGTGENAAATWAMNTYLPTLVCRRYRESRIMAFSTGNVYPHVSVEGDWSREDDDLLPVGEYGMSALGRERMFQYFCKEYQIPTSLVRLNYAVEMRYGVLVDIARQVFSGETIDLSMGYANVIWQGDANAISIAALAEAEVPAKAVNLAGPEMLCVETVANQFAESFGVKPKFSGQAATTALLNDGSAAHARYGKPRVTMEQMIEWIADWISRDQPSLEKPTHFEVRSGKF